MSGQKVTVYLDPETIGKLDALVAAHGFKSRGKAVDWAVNLYSRYERHKALRRREAAKLDPAEEVALAEEFIQAIAETWTED